MIELALQTYWNTITKQSWSWTPSLYHHKPSDLISPTEILNKQMLIETFFEAIINNA